MTLLFILNYRPPNFAIAVAVLSLFIIFTITHAVQFSRYRAWYMIPVIVGGVFESFAYICRIIIYSSPRSCVPHLISSTLALVAPAIIAATIYMIFGRIIRLLHAEHHSLVPVDALTKLCVCFEIIAFKIQSAGAGMQFGNNNTLERAGEIIIVAALLLRIIAFCLFLVIALVFHKRILKQPTHKSLGSLQWELHLGALYVAGVLSLMRDIVRAVEYVQGSGGYIRMHEYFLYAFDATPMIGVMLLMVAVYAPRLLQQHTGGRLEEATELPSYERAVGLKA